MISVKFSYLFFHFFSLSSLQFLNFQRLNFVLWIIHYHTILSLLHVFLRVFLLCNFFCFLQFLYFPLSLLYFISYFHLQFSPMDCSKPGFPVHHQHPELAQTHGHWYGDAIQPFHSLLPASPALSLSQHQGVFQWVSSLHLVAKVLELQLQDQSFQRIFRVVFLRIGLL